MAELEDFFDVSTYTKTKEEQMPMEEEERVKEKEKTAKEVGRGKRSHRKKRPMKK